MYCPRCGANLSDGVVECPQCGFSLTDKGMTRHLRLTLSLVLVAVGIVLAVQIVLLVASSIVPDCNGKLVVDDVKGFDFDAAQVIPYGTYPNADFSDLEVSEAYVDYSYGLSDRADIVVERLQGRDVTRIVNANVVYLDAKFQVTVPFTITYVLEDDGWQPQNWRAGEAVVTPRT